MKTPSGLTITEITELNHALMDEVYSEILSEIEKGTTRFDNKGNDSRFSEIPHFKSLIAKRNHDILCFPK